MCLVYESEISSLKEEFGKVEINRKSNQKEKEIELTRASQWTNPRDRAISSPRRDIINPNISGIKW